MSLDSSSIEIEVYNNGKTHRLLKLLLFVYECASILLTSIHINQRVLATPTFIGTWFYEYHYCLNFTWTTHIQNLQTLGGYYVQWWECHETGDARNVSKQHWTLWESCGGECRRNEHTCTHHTHYLYITIGILTSLHNVHIHTFWALLNTLHLIYRVDFASYLYIHHACMQAYYRNRVHSMKKEEAKCQLLKHMCQPSTTSAYFPVKVGPTYVATCTYP